MNILIIETPGDTIRHTNILQQFAFQSTKYDYQIVPAIMNPAMPQIGIMRSFKKCIQIAKNNGWEEVCILEDDFKCLHQRSLEWFFETWEELTWEFEGILLGGIYEGDPHSVLEEAKFHKVVGKLSGLHATIIPEQLYDKILSAEEPYNLDYWLSELSDIAIFVAYPMLIMQQDGYSYNAGKITDYTSKIHLKYKMINQNFK